MVAIQIPDEIIGILVEIWHHLGLNDDQRNRALDSLRADLSEFVLKFVEQEERHVEGVKSHISKARNNISAMLDSLGEEESVEIDDQDPLLEQLRKLELQERVILERTKAVAVQMETKLNELKSVYQQLGMEIPEEFAEVGCSDLTQSRLTYVDAALDQACQERRSRQAKMTKLLATANLLAKQLEKPTIEIDGITPKDQSAAESRLNELQKAMSHTSQKLDEVRALVQKRWTDLAMSTEHISTFTKSLGGLVAADLRLFKSELDRLNKQYAIALPKLIHSCHERISALHAELRHVKEEGEKSQPEDLTEATLQALEQQESSLKSELDDMRSVLQQISKWEKLREELIEGSDEISAYANDPNRFHGRQAFKMLKKQEDIHRLESKTLPRMQEKLEVLVQNWEREHNQPLIIDGKPFLSTLKERSINGKENSLKTPSASPCITKTPNVAAQSPGPGLVRRASLNSTSKKVAATPDSVPRPRRLRVSAAGENGRSSPLMRDRLAKIIEHAEQASKSSRNGCSEEILASISQAIEDLNAADVPTRMKHADALSDLYHKRAVIYTHLGDYDASIRDSEAAQVVLSWGRNFIN